MGRRYQATCRHGLPLLAILLIALARIASGQEYPAPQYAQSYPTLPGPAPQFQQPPNFFNFTDANARVDVGSMYTTEANSGGWPQCYITSEALLLWRDNHYPDDVVGDFDKGVGPRIFAGVRPDGDWEFQGGYFGVFDMKASATYLPDDYTTTTTTVAFTSELNNAEINVLRTFDDFAFLVGFRYLGLNDGFDARGVRPGVYTEEYQTSVQNNLYGGQLGLRMRRDADGIFLEATAKAGLFSNNGQAGGFVEYTDALTPLHAAFPKIVDRNIASVGDLNLTAGFHITQVWGVRAGYNALWINNVALAPDRVGFDNEPFAPLYLHRRVFLHGANVGLEAVW